MSGPSNSPVNAILIGLVGVLIGFIGGYMIGQNNAPVAATSAGAVFGQQSTANCPHNLEAKDIGILAGFRCPGTEDSQVLLTDCHCGVAHGIMDLTKAELAAGKSPEEIRGRVEADYSDRLKFAGQ
jgi:cytochrome c-type biogenesis protein CcmH/NrfF